jgi:hypothetical protein
VDPGDEQESLTLLGSLLIFSLPPPDTLGSPIFILTKMKETKGLDGMVMNPDDLPSVQFIQAQRALEASGRKLGPTAERVLMDLYLRVKAWQKAHPEILKHEWGDENSKSAYRDCFVMAPVANLFKQLTKYNILPPPLYVQNPRAPVTITSNPAGPTAIYRK